MITVFTEQLDRNRVRKSMSEEIDHKKHGGVGNSQYTWKHIKVTTASWMGWNNKKTAKVNRQDGGRHPGGNTETHVPNYTLITFYSDFSTDISLKPVCVLSWLRKSLQGLTLLSEQRFRERRQKVAKNSNMLKVQESEWDRWKNCESG